MIAIEPTEEPSIRQISCSHGDISYLAKHPVFSEEKQFQSYAKALEWLYERHMQWARTFKRECQGRQSAYRSADRIQRILAGVTTNEG